MNKMEGKMLQKQTEFRIFTSLIRPPLRLLPAPYLVEAREQIFDTAN